MRNKFTTTVLTSILLFATVVSCLSCSEKSGETPEQVIKRYEHLVGEMKADSISQLFTVDGEASHEGMGTIKSRDSIYHMLTSFTDYKMLMNRDSVTNVSMHGDSAVVKGIYIEKLVAPGNDTESVRGEFTSRMIKDKDQHWLIYSMRTRSL